MLEWELDLLFCSMIHNGLLYTFSNIKIISCIAYLLFFIFWSIIINDIHNSLTYSESVLYTHTHGYLDNQNYTIIMWYFSEEGWLYILLEIYVRIHYIQIVADGVDPKQQTFSFW